VRDQVISEVRKHKKGELMAEKFKNATGDIDAIGQKLNLTPTDADNVTFANGYIQGIGNEAAVLGTIFSLKPNQVSKPIIGDNGVVVLTVKSFKDAVEMKDFSAQAKQMADQRKSRSDYE